MSSEWTLVALMWLFALIQVVVMTIPFAIASVGVLYLLDSLKKRTK